MNENNYTDIFYLHKQVGENIKKNKDYIDKIDNEIDKLNRYIIDFQNKSLFNTIKKDIDYKISLLQEEKKCIETKVNSYNFYLLEFKDIGNAYNKELSSRKKISFMKTTDSKKENKMIKIYEDFYKLLKKYDFECQQNSDSDITKISDKTHTCKCGSSQFIFDSSIEICENCGIEREIYDVNINNTKSSLSKKFTIYERKVHFKENINQFQGKQNTHIKKEIYDSIERQLESYGLLNDTCIKEKRFENITKQHIVQIMKELKITKYYEDYILIYRNLTGKKVDDIPQNIENALLDDFDLFVKEYDKKYSSNTIRKSFINTRILLYQLLKKNKYPCKTEDFKILKTLERLSFHDDIIRDVFAILGWNSEILF